MKIDLHLHSLASVVNGDSIQFKSALHCVKTMHLKGVEAFAFTDHNTFNLSLYKELKEIVKNNMIVFPGVEINVLKESGKIAHILVIFDNNLSNKELEKIELICKYELHKKGIRIMKLNKMFNEFGNIKIPHVGKSDHFKFNELNFLDHDAIETVSENNSNYKNWLKFQNNKSIVGFSDTHIWSNYPQNSFIYTEIDFDGSFKDLKNKLNQNKKYIKKQT